MSAAQKHEREAVRLITSMRSGIKADVQARGGRNAHKWLVVTFQDVTVQVCVSSSPTNADNWLRQIKANTLRAFRAKGVILPT